MVLVTTDDDDDQHPNALAEQASEIIDAETTWTDLASKLDVARYQYGDSHPDYATGTPFRPMFLTYLWAEVEDTTTGRLRSTLADEPELAAAMGFEPDDLPSPATFRPSRIEDRFEDLEYRIRTAGDAIRDMSAERGAPIGYDLGKVETAAEDDEPSERTVQRLLRKKGKEVLDELKNVAIPSISLPRPENAIYDEEELLTHEAISAIDQAAANGAGETMGDLKNPDPDLDDPFYEDGPTGETLLEAIKDMSVDEIATVMNFALRKTYTRAKPRLQELENDNGSRFGVRSKIALDITYVAYYGDRDEMQWVQGTPKDKSYEWCHKFATAVIVGENTHFVVGVCPLGSTEYADTDAHPGKDISYYIGDVARRLLSIANDYVNIRMVYADREFHAADVIHTLQQKDLNYVIPAVKNSRIARMCNRFDQLKRGYDEPNNTVAYVDRDVSMYGSVRNDATNTEVESHVVVLPPDEDDDVRPDDSPQPFLTNLDVDDATPFDREWATKKMNEYSDRGAIENSYSSVKEAAAYTTSKEFEPRWFHFAFGCLVYNMWLLVDFLTQERIGVIETREKPRIQLKRFLRWLTDAVVRLI